MECNCGNASSAMQKLVVSFKDPIKLNVGGKLFMTSKSTLQNKESMFSAMFSGRYALEKGEDGAYFIDRDPKHFASILNFLRDGEFEAPLSKAEKREIIREAQYYSMPELVDYLSDGLGPNDQIKRQFDMARKGPHITIEDMTATSGFTWQSVFVASISKGIHKCTFSWTGSYIMIGVTGANIDHTASGMHTQAHSMMLYNFGSLHVSNVVTKDLPSYDRGDVTVEMDCRNRTVTWIFHERKFTEDMPDDMKAPFSFCADLVEDSAVTIIALQ